MTAGREPAEREMVADGGAANQRLDRWLASVVAELSRSRIKALIEAGHVRRDGATVRDPAEPVRPGARYVLAVPPPHWRSRCRSGWTSRSSTKTRI